MKLLYDQGALPLYGNGDNLSKVIAGDSRRWSEVVQQANIQLE